MTGSGRAAVWVLLGPHKGDNDQVLALAEALGLPFRPIQLRYRWFAHLPAVFRTMSLHQLAGDCRGEIRPPWPSLVLGIGQRSAPVARYVQRASGGRTKTVRLGDPMVSHRLFDLVITTTQYAVRDADNVLRLPITITNQNAVRPADAEKQWLAAFPRPRRLLVVGGKTSLWRFDESVIGDTLTSLQQRASAEGGSVLAVTSPRTGKRHLAAARSLLGEAAVVNDDFPRYGTLLNAVDEIHVTGDSVSMLSDAVASGKPVGLVPLERDLPGNFVRWAGGVRGRPFRVRNLERFWSDLQARGLVGTIEQPRSGKLEMSPTDIAVAAVRDLLDSEVPARTFSRSGAATGKVPEPIPL
ncbi:MAG TPA: ELM1/GtrOC1 family putative glycosyltransferase [Sphingomicrobium sp.]